MTTLTKCGLLNLTAFREYNTYNQAMMYTKGPKIGRGIFVDEGISLWCRCAECHDIFSGGVDDIMLVMNNIILISMSIVICSSVDGGGVSQDSQDERSS